MKCYPGAPEDPEERRALRSSRRQKGEAGWLQGELRVCAIPVLPLEVQNTQRDLREKEQLEAGRHGAGIGRTGCWPSPSRDGQLIAFGFGGGGCYGCCLLFVSSYFCKKVSLCSPGWFQT